jgi:hypothetical protein
MRKHKRFTNVTFTKRVDHEGGEKHAPRGMAEPGRCTVCGSVYVDKHWVAAGSGETTRHSTFRPARGMTCPACVQVREGIYGGLVSLEGVAVADRFPEIEAVVRHAAEDAMRANPLSRVMKIERSVTSAVVTTTTEQLAQRIGKALERAFGGHTDFVFSHENKVAHVTWRSR